MKKLMKSRNVLIQPFPSFRCIPLAWFHCSDQPYTWGQTHLNGSEINKKKIGAWELGDYFLLLVRICYVIKGEYIVGQNDFGHFLEVI